MNARSSFLVPTYTGQLVDLLAPKPEQITREAIAHHLAQIARWVGATQTHFSVAQHSLLVSEAVRLPRAKLHALLHDAHEFVLGDITRPTEDALEWLAPGAGRAIRQIKNNLDEAIWQHFDLEAPDEAIIAAIADADRQLAATEWRDCLPTQPCPSPYAGIRALSRAIPNQGPAYIEFMFLNRLEQLLGLEAYRKQQAAE